MGLSVSVLLLPLLVIFCPKIGLEFQQLAGRARIRSKNLYTYSLATSAPLPWLEGSNRNVIFSGLINTQIQDKAIMIVLVIYSPAWSSRSACSVILGHDGDHLVKA